MNCPKCSTVMRERERDVQGMTVVMDVCPACGGVWLDRGELETLTRVERREYREYFDRRDDDDDDYKRDRGYYKGEKKSLKKSLFSNLFELGD